VINFKIKVKSNDYYVLKNYISSNILFKKKLKKNKGKIIYFDLCLKLFNYVQFLSKILLYLIELNTLLTNFL